MKKLLFFILILCAAGYWGIREGNSSVKDFPRRGQHRDPNHAAQKKTGSKNSPAGSVRLLPRPP